MKEQDVELVIARGTEKHPGVKPRIISDNGPQFIAKDFREFVREYGLTHVRTSPYYPQSNGKLERWHGSLKSECIRSGCPATKEEAEKRIANYVHYYNTVRLHSAIGYITPADCLAGLSEEICNERDRKLEAARQLRQERRVAAKQVAYQILIDYNECSFTKDRALQRCNLNVVKPEVGMPSGRLPRTAPFHSDFGNKR
jgi:hypothetical protein